MKLMDNGFPAITLFFISLFIIENRQKYSVKRSIKRKNNNNLAVLYSSVYNRVGIRHQGLGRVTV